MQGLKSKVFKTYIGCIKSGRRSSVEQPVVGSSVTRLYFYVTCYSGMLRHRSTMRNILKTNKRLFLSSNSFSTNFETKTLRYKLPASKIVFVFN